MMAAGEKLSEFHRQQSKNPLTELSAAGHIDGGSLVGWRTAAVLDLLGGSAGMDAAIEPPKVVGPVVRPCGCCGCRKKKSNGTPMHLVMSIA